MELAAAIAAFAMQLRADGRASLTVEQYLRHLRLLDAWLARTRRPADVTAITPETLAAFLNDDVVRLLPDGSPKRATSVNAVRASVRALFAYLHDGGQTPTNAARLVRSARCSRLAPRSLSEDECRRLLAAVDSEPGEAGRRDAVLVRVLLRTGARLSSVLALRTEDIDLARGELYLRMTKGDAPLTQPMNREMTRVLATYLRGRPAGVVFAGPEGKPLSRRHAGRRIAMAAERAGLVGKATAHSLRHSYALRLYERTHDVLLVQRALGHRSVASTMVYTTVSAKRLRAALAR